jgi:hypothetical protein
MAQLQDLSITGSFLLGTTENTGSAGNFWYDQTTNQLKYTYSFASWKTGGAMITARGCIGGTGTGGSDSSLAIGGFQTFQNTEEYNGTSWSSGGNLIYGRFSMGAAGTQNAGLAFGGNCCNFPTIARACTEEYDGTSWSSGGALINVRWALAGAGEQNSGLAFGGALGNAYCDRTEEYDGTSWSNAGNLITTRGCLAGSGTQNAALAVGGFRSPPATVSCTEEYNGTSWSAGGAYFSVNSLASAGTQNSTIAFGGTPAITNARIYDGSTWTTTCSLNTGRRGLGGGGQSTDALAFGGLSAPGAGVCCTEEFVENNTVGLRCV